jgi:multiple sugar transport system permease protein
MAKIRSHVTADDVISNILLYLLAAIMLFPFIWLVSTSLKLPEHVLAWPPTILPRQPTLSNYTAVFEKADMGRFFVNSLRFAGISTIAILFTSALAGYVFAKYEFPFKEWFFVIIIATMMVPFQCYMIPLYMMMVKIKAVDTYLGMQLPYLVQAFGTFFMRQNFETLPTEYLEAARLEGASEFAIFWRVALPCMSSAIGGLTIFVFSGIWGNLLWPMVITSSEHNFVLEQALTFFQQRFTVNYGEFTAAATIVIAPVILVFLLFRKQIMEGITLSGIK